MIAAVSPPADATAPSSLLEVTGLNVSFGSVRALSDVNLVLAPGELVAVAGEPGAGKTTLVRCITGDIAPGSGEILMDGREVPVERGAAKRRGIAVVWQDLALCDNLDVAGNILLGQETRRLLMSPSRFHAAAVQLLADLQIPLRDTRQLVGSLSGGQRQLVAMAKALIDTPRLLVLDEPTASLGVKETAQIEGLITRLHDQGSSILLASRDKNQMLGLADRILVLRQGHLVAELDPRSTHPDELTAVLSGQRVDSSARRQLTRLHGLADRLESADPSSSLSLILSALGAALGTEKVCIHVVSESSLVCAASLGFTAPELAPSSRLPLGAAGGPAGRAALQQERVIEGDLRSSGSWAGFGELADSASVASSWSVPVTGPGGVSAVITVFRSDPGAPQRDELDLLTLYAGYAASAVERDRLLDQVTSRNRVLETIREMLETLAGPATVSDGLQTALDALRGGLQADEVGLLTLLGTNASGWRAYSGPQGTDPAVTSDLLAGASLRALASERDGRARRYDNGGRRALAVPFLAPAGPAALVATWTGPPVSPEETALIEDAAHSLRLALEREKAALARQEATALRRSRELQRGFLSRLSHELRTPLTAIRGYASSLMQPDVTWDGESEQRFLDRIAAESARLGRLVDDLLDFSAIESGVMRLQLDWCDLPLVLEAARSCLPAEHAAAVTVDCAPTLPAVWADHDRLEQVFVNLLTNALRHNPPGTRVSVTAGEASNRTLPAADSAGGLPGAAEIEITIADDGVGFPPDLAFAPFDTARRQRSPTSGAGLGLSITRGIIDAHGGRIALVPSDIGTTFKIRLLVEAGAAPGVDSEVSDPGANEERPASLARTPTPALVPRGDG